MDLSLGRQQTTRRRKALTIKEKIAILDEYKRSGATVAATKFGIKRCHVYKILKQETELRGSHSSLSDRKRMKRSAAGTSRQYPIANGQIEDQPNNDQNTHGDDGDYSLTFDDDLAHNSDDSGYTQGHDNLVTRSDSSDISEFNDQGEDEESLVMDEGQASEMVRNCEELLGRIKSLIPSTPQHHQKNIHENLLEIEKGMWTAIENSVKETTDNNSRGTPETFLHEASAAYGPASHAGENSSDRREDVQNRPERSREDSESSDFHEMRRLPETVHSANITPDRSEPVSSHPLSEVPTVITDIESPSGKDSIAEDHMVTSDMQDVLDVENIGPDSAPMSDGTSNDKLTIGDLRDLLVKMQAQYDMMTEEKKEEAVNIKQKYGLRTKEHEDKCTHQYISEVVENAKLEEEMNEITRDYKGEIRAMNMKYWGLENDLISSYSGQIDIQEVRDFIQTLTNQGQAEAASFFTRFLEHELYLQTDHSTANAYTPIDRNLFCVGIGPIHTE